MRHPATCQIKEKNITESDCNFTVVESKRKPEACSLKQDGPRRTCPMQFYVLCVQIVCSSPSCVLLQLTE